MKLSPHQKRVLAALHALETRHDWRWWPREAIGCVVDAGGYHAVIQRATIRILKGHGLVETERSSWPAEVQARVACHCACATWGLTAAGRAIAAKLKVAGGGEFPRNVELAKYYAHAGVCMPNLLRDEDGTRDWGDDEDDDDEDDPPPSPPPRPSPASHLVPASG